MTLFSYCQSTPQIIPMATIDSQYLSQQHRPAPRSSLLAPTTADAFLSASNVTLTMTVVTTVMNPTVLPPNLCRGLKRAWQILVAMPNLRTMRPKDSLLSTSSPSPATKFMPDRRNGWAWKWNCWWKVLPRKLKLHRVAMPENNIEYRLWCSKQIVPFKYLRINIQFVNINKLFLYTLQFE